LNAVARSRGRAYRAVPWRHEQTNHAEAKTVSAHEQRIRRLKKIMADKGADAALITRERDVAYLTGFLGGDSVLLVPARGKPVFVSDRRYEEDLQAFKHLATIQMRSGAMHPHLGG
jgi:Xaa-Pro aminopeptidase